MMQRALSCTLPFKRKSGEGFFEAPAVEISFSDGLFADKQISAFSEKSCMARECCRAMTSSKNGRKTDETELLAIGEAQATVWFNGRLGVSSALIPSEVVAAQLPSCSGLAAGLLAGEGVSVATSAVHLAAGGHLSDCLVNITVSELAGQKDGYLPGQKQMINIGIGFP